MPPSTGSRSAARLVLSLVEVEGPDTYTNPATQLRVATTLGKPQTLKTLSTTGRIYPLCRYVIEESIAEARGQTLLRMDSDGVWNVCSIPSGRLRHSPPVLF